MAKIITLYNHKGGVSKTTTTFNLAHLLASRGNRTLIVDADAQCNITELSLAPLIAKLDKKMEETGEETSLPGTTLLHLLKPRIDGDVPEINVDSAKTIKVKNKLDLLPGSVDLNNIEDSLAEAHIQRFSGKIHEKRTYVAIGDFLLRFAEKKKYDFVFLDVGPSSGALTRACFLACDAFFVPVSPDRFNVQAIGTLTKIIDRWLREHTQITSDFKALGLPIRPGKPFFLGTITQAFKLHGGRPKPGYRLWIERIPQRVKDELVPMLQKHSSSERELCRFVKRGRVSATEISDFGSLAPLMQELGKPVYEITPKDTAIITEAGKPWGGGTWTDAQERMNRYKDCFETLADKLEQLKAL